MSAAREHPEPREMALLEHEREARAVAEEMTEAFLGDQRIVEKILRLQQHHIREDRKAMTDPLFNITRNAVDALQYEWEDIPRDLRPLASDAIEALLRLQDANI